MDISKFAFSDTSKLPVNKTNPALKAEFDTKFGVSGTGPIYRNLFIVDNKQLKFRGDISKTEYKKLTNIYKADSIFNRDYTLIENILTPYLNPTHMNKINDYKIFCLFANYANDKMTEMKCEHQYKLLETTENFLKIE